MSLHEAAASDLSACDREPIHAPGGIQPHGYLFVIDEGSMTVVQASANTVELLNVPVDSMLGARFDTVLGAECAARVSQSLTMPAPDVSLDEVPLYLGELAYGTQLVDIVLHRRKPVLMVELERRIKTVHTSFASMYPLVRSFVTRLQQADTVNALAKHAVAEIRRITGFGRTLLYQFDEDGHGVVLAEECESEYERFLHHHFPASDIPKQARALYLKHHLRLIADANYVPVPLVPAVNPVTREPTDLSVASLRSVAPVHLEYLRNMRTMASMSVSLIVRGKLWGMISCHDHAPRFPDFATRTVCEHLGQVLSLQIEAKEDREESMHRHALRHTLVELLSSMADHSDFVDGLIEREDAMLKLGASNGVAPEVLEIADWLAKNQRGLVFATDHLGAQMSLSGADLSHVASGLLAVPVSQLYRHYVMWFRPEVLREVQWAGEPHKSLPGDPDMRISPRKSFASWLAAVARRRDRHRTRVPHRHAWLRLAARRGNGCPGGRAGPGEQGA
jgi:chemotaxis family two-component system sensor kinase Cph1